MVRTNRPDDNPRSPTVGIRHTAAFAASSDAIPEADADGRTADATRRPGGCSEGGGST